MNVFLHKFNSVSTYNRIIQYNLVSRIPGDLIQYTLVSRTPGDHRNLFALAGIRNNRCLEYQKGFEWNITVFVLIRVYCTDCYYRMEILLKTGGIILIYLVYFYQLIYALYQTTAVINSVLLLYWLNNPY